MSTDAVRVAVDEAFRDEWGRVVATLIRTTGDWDLAEECAQDAFALALQRWPRDGIPGRPGAWLTTAARNRAIDIVRKRGEVSIEDEPDAQNVAAESPAPLARREMTEELKRLLSCLGKLDPEKQRIVLLAYYSGWSREQLSTKLDIPVNTIKTWLRRSLLEIRECMGR